MATEGLGRLAQLDDDELDALIEIARARADGQLSRRDLLKSAGAVGGAALLGGSAVGAASASADDGDNDAVIGTQSSPVDVWADGVTASAVSTGEINSIVWPDPGEDIAQYLASGTAIMLQPTNADSTPGDPDYTLSRPINTNERASFALMGLSSGTDGNERVTVKYTGDSAKGPMYFDGSNFIVKFLVDNVTFFANGADYGAFIRSWGGESEIRNAEFTDFSDSSVAGIDLSDETYGYFDNVLIEEKTAALDYGVRLSTDKDRVNNVRFDNLRVEMSDTSGVGFATEGGTVNATLDKPMIEGTGLEAYKIDSSDTNVDMYHPYLEGFGGAETNAGDPTGMHLSSGVVNIYGGIFSGSTGGSAPTGGNAVQVDTGVWGGLYGSRFLRTDVDQYITNNSKYWFLHQPRYEADPGNGAIDSDGPLFGVKGFGGVAPSMRWDGARWEIEDKDGTDVLDQISGGSY